MPKKESHGPLLYIYQPFSRTPSNNMQEVYTIKWKELQEEMQARGEDKKKNSPSKVKDEPVLIEIDATENQQVSAPSSVEKHRTAFNKVKSFKEMDVKERLDYLLHFPKVLPPVPCVFYMKDKNYQGYLIDFANDQATIQFHDQTTKIIDVHELKDIMMIGIKK